MAPVKIEDWNKIETIVAMCVGTDKGTWWASPDFGSNLWKLKRTGKTTESLASDVKMEIEDCLSWLVTDGLARSVTCTATVVGKTSVEWIVTVERPEGGTQIIKDVWNAV